MKECKLTKLGDKLIEEPTLTQGIKVKHYKLSGWNWN